MSHRKKRIVVPAIVIAAIAMAVGGTSAQSPEIDPQAMTALGKMTAYLSTLDAFQVQADITTEVVLTDGQKIQMGSVADMVAVRPNRLRVDLADDRQQRLLLYDGTTFTVWAPRLKYYTDVAAPPSTRELITLIENRFDLELPLVDLFRWGSAQSDLRGITSAKYIGPSQVEGVTCDQYAFRQDGLDWQVWIQKGRFPLPRKVVLTTMTDEARPQHEAIYSWNLAPSYNEGSFAFVAPSDAKRIPIAEAAATVGSPEDR